MILTKKLTIAITALVFASGLLTNMGGYIFIIVFMALGACKQKLGFRLRYLLIISTLLLILDGTILGLYNGHDPAYIFRFTIPFCVFLLLMFTKNISYSIFYHRRKLVVLGVIFTFFVFILINLKLYEWSFAILKGWSISAASAVGVWHYFFLTITVTVIYEFFASRRSFYNLRYATIGFASIILLLLITKTSAFYLAVIACIFPILFEKFNIKVFKKPLLWLGLILVSDYLTFQFFGTLFIETVGISNLADAGNNIRLIQIDYFLQRSSLFGAGFGGELFFDFSDFGNREYSHRKNPYASELPLLNVIHGAGIFGAIWFFLILYTFIASMVNLSKLKKQNKTYAFFGCSCCLILYGSISNPFLFSPVSMLLIAITLEVYEHSLALTQNRKVIETPKHNIRASRVY